MESFAKLNPVVQALLAPLFTWGVTALGAAAVFLFRNVDRRFLHTALGFVAGVMIAASFWVAARAVDRHGGGDGHPLNGSRR